MTLKEKEEQLKQLRQHTDDKTQAQIEQLQKDMYQDLSAYDRVYLARKNQRPHIHDYINHLFDDFIELKGDRFFHDDQAIVGGIGYFERQPVTIIGHQKGSNLVDNMKSNFGMGSPEGYRKAMRLMKQAEKFHRPIITFIDTPGAYPGLEAEANGIGEAIGQSLMLMSELTVPIIVFVVGEGGSGGALALSVGDYIVMLENAVYSILSPEGFSTILWKDPNRVQEACEVMKLTAQDLLEAHIIDEIVPEVEGGIHIKPSFTYQKIRLVIEKQLEKLNRLSDKELIKRRYEKFRKIGQVHG